MSGGAAGGKGAATATAAQRDRVAGLSELPPSVHARFSGYTEAALLDPAHRELLVSRLMEEGSGEELRWLLAAVGRGPLAVLLVARGGRLLSRRSRAFWARLLGVESAPAHPLASELWPLA